MLLELSVYIYQSIKRKGWEGIGVCSYLLISYYAHRLSAAKSATKAILVNRVSDGMLLWGVLSIWWNLGSLDYDLISFTNTQSTSWFLGLALLIGAMGKSAQILFHVWLADSMEGLLKSIKQGLLCCSSFPKASWSLVLESSTFCYRINSTFVSL